MLHGVWFEKCWSVESPGPSSSLLFFKLTGRFSGPSCHSVVWSQQPNVTPWMGEFCQCQGAESPEKASPENISSPFPYNRTVSLLLGQECLAGWAGNTAVGILRKSSTCWWRRSPEERNGKWCQPACLPTLLLTSSHGRISLAWVQRG